MAELRYLDLYKEENISNIKPIYLLYGKEAVLKEEAIKIITTSIFKDKNSEFDFEDLSEETDINKIKNSLNTLPFLSKKRILLIRGIEKFPKQEIVKLNSYFENPSPSTSVILVKGEPNKGWDVEKIIISQETDNIIRKNGDIIRCSFIYEHEIFSWIRNKIMLSGKTIDKEALQYFVIITGADLAQINSEIEKLILYTGDNNTIFKNDVEEVVIPKIESKIYDITDQICAKAKNKALSSINFLIKTGEEKEKILGVLRRHFRLLWQTKVLLNKGVLFKSRLFSSYKKNIEQLLPEEENILKFKKNQYIFNKYIKQAGFFSEESIIKALYEIFLCELSIKGIENPVDSKIAIEMLILNLCSIVN